MDIIQNKPIKRNFSIVEKKNQSSRLTLSRLTGVPQEHFKLMLLDVVWKGTLPPQAPHLKFKTSSVISCITGQSSWQGMQLQSNQYCALSLCYFEKLQIDSTMLKRNEKFQLRPFLSEQNATINISTYHSIRLGRMKKDGSVIFTNFFAFFYILDCLDTNIVFNVETNDARITRVVEHSQSWITCSSNICRFCSFLSISSNHFKLKKINCSIILYFLLKLGKIKALLLELWEHKRNVRPAQRKISVNGLQQTIFVLGKNFTSL